MLDRGRTSGRETSHQQGAMWNASGSLQGTAQVGGCERDFLVTGSGKEFLASQELDIGGVQHVLWSPRLRWTWACSERSALVFHNCQPCGWGYGIHRFCCPCEGICVFLSVWWATFAPGSLAQFWPCRHLLTYLLLVGSVYGCVCSLYVPMWGHVCVCTHMEVRGWCWAYTSISLHFF